MRTTDPVTRFITPAILFTILYLVCEAIYNIGLVDFLSSKNTEIAVFNKLEFFGKTLSAVGLTLFLTKFIRLKSAKKLLSFVVLVPTLFMLETYAFDHVVHSLSPEAKTKAYILGAYRNAVINGQIPSPITEHVELAAIGLSTQLRDDQANQVKQLLSVSIDTDSLMSFYGQYKTISDKLDGIYATYALASKKWEGHTGFSKEVIDKQFMRHVGMPQGLDKKGFFEALSKSSEPFAKFQKTIFIPGNEKLGIESVTGADIPLGMDETAFKAFFQGKLDIIKAKTAMVPQNVENLPYAYEIISSIYIPPIAIVLSLLSIVLNLSSVLYQVNKRAVIVMPALVVAGAFASTVQVSSLIKPVLNVERSMLTTLSPLVYTLHRLAINDEHPNEQDIIRIKKPEPLNLDDLEKKLKGLQNDASADMPNVDSRIVVDEERLSTEKGYFGEVKKSGNINPYTGQPY